MVYTIFSLLGSKVKNAAQKMELERAAWDEARPFSPPDCVSRVTKLLQVINNWRGMDLVLIDQAHEDYLVFTGFHLTYRQHSAECY